MEGLVQGKIIDVVKLEVDMVGIFSVKVQIICFSLLLEPLRKCMSDIVTRRVRPR